MFETIHNQLPYLVIYTANGCAKCSVMKRRIAKAGMNHLIVNIDNLDNTNVVRQALIDHLPSRELPIIMAYNLFDKGPVMFNGVGIDQLRYVTNRYTEVATEQDHQQWQEVESELLTTLVTQTEKATCAAGELPYGLSVDGEITVY